MPPTDHQASKPVILHITLSSDIGILLEQEVSFDRPISEVMDLPAWPNALGEIESILYGALEDSKEAVLALRRPGQRYWNIDDPQEEP